MGSSRPGIRTRGRWVRSANATTVLCGPPASTYLKQGCSLFLRPLNGRAKWHLGLLTDDDIYRNLLCLSATARLGRLHISLIATQLIIISVTVVGICWLHVVLNWRFSFENDSGSAFLNTPALIPALKPPSIGPEYNLDGKQLGTLDSAGMALDIAAA